MVVGCVNEVARLGQENEVIILINGVAVRRVLLQFVIFDLLSSK